MKKWEAREPCLLDEDGADLHSWSRQSSIVRQRLVLVTGKVHSEDGVVGDLCADDGGTVGGDGCDGTRFGTTEG